MAIFAVNSGGVVPTWICDILNKRAPDRPLAAARRLPGLLVAAYVTQEPHNRKFKAPAQLVEVN